MQAKDICLLASREAKGGAGMVALAGQYLNLVLEDLKLNRDLKVNRVTQLVTVGTGTNGPFSLETDYLRTYDMFYPLQGPSGETQFLIPITMEQYDAEFKGTQTANYPYEFATDLSTQAQAASAVTAGGAVTALPYAATGMGYLTNPAFTFGGPGTGAAGTATLQAVAAVIFAAGVGYVNGEIVTLVGGTFTRPATIRIVLSGSFYEVVDGGSYTILPGTPTNFGGLNVTGAAGSLATTGGSGAGLTLMAVWGLGNGVVTAGGADYAVAPAVTVTGGTPNTAGTMTASVSPITTSGKGQFYIYPQSNGSLVLTHRYMRDQPDMVAPETSTAVPWFPFAGYLVKRTAASLMGVTGDDRQAQYLTDCENMLRPHLIMEGDEQQAVHRVRLDPRQFKSSRGLRPTKLNPY